MKVWLIIAGFWLALLVVGCGAVESSVTLYQDEEWAAETTLALNTQEAAQLSATLEAQIEQAMAAAKKQGREITYSKTQEGDDTVFHFAMQGKGWQELNTRILNDQAQIETKDNQVTIRYAPGFINVRSMTLRLTGGSIISSNADEVKGNTAIWHDAGSRFEPMEVTMIPASKSALSGLPCVGGAALFLIVPLGLIYTNRKRIFSLS